MCRRRRRTLLPARWAKVHGRRRWGGGGFVVLVPGSIFPTWRHDLYIYICSLRRWLRSLPIFLCAWFIRKSEKFKMCSVRIPPKTEDPPCVCLGNKRGRRLLGGVWAGYLDLVWCWLSKNAVRWVSSWVLGAAPHKRRGLKAEGGHKFRNHTQKKLINTFLTTLP